MTIKIVHTFSGICLSMFIGLHLFNHFYSILGADKHIELMTMLRYFYRNIFVETILVFAVFIQIISGLALFKANRKKAISIVDKLQIWTGLYLAFFLLVHLGAVFIGRFFLHLDTNFYFGVAGLNHFPINLFFIPYYGLAIVSFFGHISVIHRKKMKQPIFGLTPIHQATCIFAFGILLTLMIFYGLTNHFQGITIPGEYRMLTGK